MTDKFIKAYVLCDHLNSESVVLSSVSPSGLTHVVYIYYQEIKSDEISDAYTKYWGNLKLLL
jgi:hypothetical protein